MKTKPKTQARVIQHSGCFTVEHGRHQKEFSGRGFKEDKRRATLYARKLNKCAV